MGYGASGSDTRAIPGHHGAMGARRCTAHKGPPSGTNRVAVTKPMNRHVARQMIEKIRQEKEEKRLSLEVRQRLYSLRVRAGQFFGRIIRQYQLRREFNRLRSFKTEELALARPQLSKLGIFSLPTIVRDETGVWTTEDLEKESSHPK